ncbi:peptide ABC transporter substrate-binding protein [Clostridium polynesiense]|uniref:peptide ABC transporter substrate-binding protein n=1 Tax=Clostridium polynesiense TaxID=1325933 RepID=UPI00059154A9|nr:peptide ABC transporter substrate-binding protein [Clostridium polynesiense]
MLKRLSKLSTVLLALAIGTTTLAGCAGSSSGSNEEKVPQIIRHNLGAEPKTIDPALNSAVDGATVLQNAFEGLMRLDENDKPIAGVAEKWDVSPDGLEYTFKLRKDAKWSDGQQVKAQDFEYAWKRALNPDTAAEYASQLYYIKNGEKYNQKQAKAEDLGIKVVDEYTLKVTLEYATAYFLSLMAFPTYFPVRKDIVEKDPEAWATKPESYISNGPFKMKEWKPKDTLTFIKNDNYWGAKNVKLDTIEFKMIEEATSALATYRADEIDIIEQPPAQETPQLLKDGVAKIYPYLGTYFYCINVSPNAEKVDPEAAKALKNPKVRKALAMSLNRQLIVDNVTKGGQLPAFSFVPKGIPDHANKDFTSKQYFNPNGDIEAAKKLLAEAGYPDGKGLPKIVLSYNTNEAHQNIAQAVQDMWKNNLSIDIELRNEEWKVFQKTRNTKNYIIARHGWIADYVDPVSFLDMWVSNSGNNDAGYSNPKYDNFIELAKKEQDLAKRTEYLHQAEDILMEDMPVIPVYYYTNVMCIKENIKDVRKSPLGFVFFDKAYVTKK